MSEYFWGDFYYLVESFDLVLGIFGRVSIVFGLCYFFVEYVGNFSVIGWVSKFRRIKGH